MDWFYYKYKQINEHDYNFKSITMSLRLSHWFTYVLFQAKSVD